MDVTEEGFTAVAPGNPALPGILAVRALVDIIGCDDSTTFEMDVTEEELTFLHRLSATSEEASRYGCMPTIEVTRLG